MSELRQDPTTREWVIMAPERAKRPQNGPSGKLTYKLPHWEASCPFCPGNESQTPPEVLRLLLPNQAFDWEVRVIPNRFVALSLDGRNNRLKDTHFFIKWKVSEHMK